MRPPNCVRPFHEPSRLRVADPRSGPRLCEAQRFMVPMRAQKRKEAFHEPCPLIPAFSPSGGEGARRAVEGDCDRFMASIHVRILEVFPSHEPERAQSQSAADTNHKLRSADVRL